MYDPRQVREDLKINARPVPMLAQFVKNGETVTPYNGSWIQQPIVRSGDVNGYVPVVRKPNAMLLDMKVKVENSSSTKVTLVIRNSGSASINALTPIAFYDGGAEGKAIGGGAVPAGSPHPVGVDIFPDEQLTLTYTLSGNFNNHLIWARIMDDGAGFPAADYDDCDFSNNIFSGIDCPYLIYMLTASPDTVLCGTSDNALLTAVNTNAHQYPPVYQWYRNGVAIPGAVSQTYTATLTGEYKCYVIEDICRGFSTGISITRDTPVAVDDNSVKVHGVPKYINVLLNDTKSQYCGLMPVIAPGDGPKNGTAAVQPDGLILYSPDPGTAAVADSIKYTIGNAGNRATVRILLYPVPPVTLLKPAKTDTAACVGSGFVFEGSYTDIDGTFGNDLVYRWEYASADSPAVWTAVAGTQGTSSSGYAASTYAISPLDASHAGCYRLAVANAAYIDDPCYRAVSDTVRLRVDRVPNYPDIRVCICPNAGNVNMAKYLDTVNEVNTNSIQWLSQIQGIPVTSPAGIVSADNLLSARVHAFTYSISSLCVSGQKRKFYVETIEHDRVHVPKDTVAMCYRHANAIQINQLFGIEAQGEWLYPASIEGYVNKSASPVFKGAVVMDGKSIYEDGSIPVAPYPYHGVDNVKMLRITYRTQNDGCLHGKEYSVVVVLTQNIAD
jgi:hypothetical protein